MAAPMIPPVAEEMGDGVLRWSPVTLVVGITVPTAVLAVLPLPQCVRALSACILLSCLFVGSLYVWNPGNKRRDHPSVIKRRFISVLVVMLISPFFVWLFIQPDSSLSQEKLWQVLGLRLEGLLPAVFFPYLLTAVLFLGPIAKQSWEGMYVLFFDFWHWKANMYNLVWFRNHVMAPLSEEFTFRACMLPLLTQCWSDLYAAFLCPLFFGIAHFHHLFERIKGGTAVRVALVQTIFQFVYTTLFGAYSSFLFLRTGHFVSSFVVHAFCNHMGFPDVVEVVQYRGAQRVLLMLAHVAGVLAWCYLLYPLTSPALYSNRIYWQQWDHTKDHVGATYLMMTASNSIQHHWQQMCDTILQSFRMLL